MLVDWCCISNTDIGYFIFQSSAVDSRGARVRSMDSSRGLLFTVSNPKFWIAPKYLMTMTNARGQEERPWKPFLDKDLSGWELRGFGTWEGYINEALFFTFKRYATLRSSLPLSIHNSWKGERNCCQSRANSVCNHIWWGFFNELLRWMCCTVQIRTMQASPSQ